MGQKDEACAECLQKCLQIHGKKKKSSTIISFFKIMIGDNFRKVLYLPPQFVAKMSKSIDETTFLEDSQGQQWTITITSVNGALAFEKGWSTFSSDHDLQVGDLLVFNFIVGSHFFVKIFDRSACEKEIFPKNNYSKKRMRSGCFEGIKIKSDGEHDNESMKRPGSSHATVSGSDIEKSPWFGEKDEPNMNRFAKKPIRGEKNKGDKNLYHQMHAPSRTQINKCTSIRSGSGSHPIAENGSKERSIKNNIALEDVDIKVSIQDKVSSIPPAIESKSGAQECHGIVEVLQFHIDKVKANLVSSDTGKNIKKENVEMISGEIGKIVKEKQIDITRDEMRKIIKEPVEVTPVEVSKTIKEELDKMNTGLSMDEENLNITVNCQNPFTMERDDNEVNKEIGLEVGNLLPSEATISCIVAENRSFLELPSSLSSLSGLEMRLEKKMVFFLDSKERLWPVMYQETLDYNALTSGWEAFGQANDIQAGQECVFKVENDVKRRYRVSIRRNS